MLAGRINFFHSQAKNVDQFAPGRQSRPSCVACTTTPPTPPHPAVDGGATLKLVPTSAGALRQRLPVRGPWTRRSPRLHKLGLADADVAAIQRGNAERLLPAPKKLTAGQTPHPIPAADLQTAGHRPRSVHRVRLQPRQAHRGSHRLVQETRPPRLKEIMTSLVTHLHAFRARGRPHARRMANGHRVPQGNGAHLGRQARRGHRSLGHPWACR